MLSLRCIRILMLLDVVNEMLLIIAITETEMFLMSVAMLVKAMLIILHCHTMRIIQQC